MESSDSTGAQGERSVSERLNNRLEQHRRIATRYKRPGADSLAMVTIAAIRLWL